MQKYETNVCPVCGGTLENGICNKCGYIRLIFPESVPTAILTQEETRISTAKKLLEENTRANSNARSEVDKLHHEITVLRQTVASQKKKIEKSDERILQYERDNKNCRNSNNILESKLNENENKLRNAKNLTDILRDENRNITSELSNTKFELEKTNREVAELRMRPKAGNTFLIIKDDGEFSVIPVENKENFYASGPGMKYCLRPESEIILLPVMTSAKLAFSIERSDSGSYYLEDKTSTLLHPRFATLDVPSHAGRDFAISGHRERSLRLANGDAISVAGTDIKIYFCINQQ